MAVRISALLDLNAGWSNDCLFDRDWDLGNFSIIVLFSDSPWYLFGDLSCDLLGLCSWDSIVDSSLSLCGDFSWNFIVNDSLNLSGVDDWGDYDSLISGGVAGDHIAGDAVVRGCASGPGVTVVGIV